MPRRVHAFSLLVALAAVGAFASVGFLVGRAGRVSQVEAARVRTLATTTAYRRAEPSAYRAARPAGYHRGWLRGIKVGRAAGTRAGAAAGQAEASSRASATAVMRRIAAVALSPVTLSRDTVKDKCILVGGGLCEVLGPGATGRPCPPSSVPTPVGGVVCVPQLLIRGSRR